MISRMSMAVAARGCKSRETRHNFSGALDSQSSTCVAAIIQWSLRTCIAVYCLKVEQIIFWANRCAGDVLTSGGNG